MYLALSPLVEHRPDRLGDVVAVPGERHLLALRVERHLLDGLAADEVVVELDVRAVAEVVRRQVVVLDVVRVEAAAERARALVPGGRQPLAVRLHLVAREDRRERAGDPPRLERVRGVHARADLPQPELLAGLDDRGLDLGALLPRPEQLEPGNAGHAVVQRAHLAAGDRDLAHVEELDLRQRAAVHLLEHLQRGRTLHLVAVDPAVVRVHRSALVALDRRVVAAGLAVVLHPVVRRRAPDEVEELVVEVEEDRVADDVAVGSCRRRTAWPCRPRTSRSC